VIHSSPVLDVLAKLSLVVTQPSSCPVSTTATPHCGNGNGKAVKERLALVMRMKMTKMINIPLYCNYFFFSWFQQLSHNGFVE
jgi:hypothetical protein